LRIQDGGMFARREVRQVTDAKVLAAMAHPLRWRLIDVLKVDGPSTASALAERTDQRVANVSHHVRVLAEAGLVEEAPELARDRRERWWRLVSASLRWSPEDFSGDPAAEAVAQAAQSLSLDRHAGHARAWFAAGDEEREPWREASFSTDKWLSLSPDELAELNRQVIDIFATWSEREVPDDGAPRESVLVFAYGVPAHP
jgi:DNA-binding transcriptional ArsR family regulator